MRGILAKAALITIVLIAATSADAQTRRGRASREVEHAPPAVSIDKRDRVVAAAGAGAFNGRSYWLALAQCGGIYFELNTLYTDAAVHARVVKPDPKANAEFTKKLDEAMRIATTYFDAAERFLMTDRKLERADAVLTYDAHARAAGEGLKTIDAALAAARACPALYQACQQVYPKACSETLAPTS